MSSQPSLRERIRDCNSLPTLPAAALRILQLTESNLPSLDQISETISRDPALSSRILRAINSSFYALEHKVSSIGQAVALLGLHSVKTLVLGFSLVNNLKGNATHGTGFNHLAYWRRSMYAATAARVIAQKVLPTKLEECFISALLMDLGTLVLDQLLGEQYGKLHAKARGHADLQILETHALGMTHAEVGGVLAEHWKLPEILRVPIGAHHGPQDVEDFSLRRITQVASLAGRVADVFCVEDAAESIAGVRRTFLELYKLNEIASDSVLVEIGQKTTQLAPLFEVRLNSAASYDDIVAKASERLLELSLAEKGTEPANKRRSNRVRRDAKVHVIPCARGILGTAVQVRMRDLSSTGIGLIHTDPFEVGSQFIIQLPQRSGPPKNLLYTVVRCDTFGGLSSVGASLAAVLRPEQAVAAGEAAA